jgi:hypothetical protein
MLYQGRTGAGKRQNVKKINNKYITGNGNALDLWRYYPEGACGLARYSSGETRSREPTEIRFSKIEVKRALLT